MVRLCCVHHVRVHRYSRCRNTALTRERSGVSTKEVEEAAKLKRRRRPKEGAVKRGATKGAGRKRKDHKKGWPTKEGGHERRVPVSIPEGATKGADRPRDGPGIGLRTGGACRSHRTRGRTDPSIRRTESLARKICHRTCSHRKPDSNSAASEIEEHGIAHHDVANP